MDYCDKLARVLIDEEVHPMKPRDITADPSFVGLYRDYPLKMISLMWHIIRDSRILTMMRDACQHHATRDTSDEGGDDDDQGDDHDHDMIRVAIMILPVVPPH